MGYDVPVFSIAIRDDGLDRIAQRVTNGAEEHLMADKLTWDDAEKIGVLLARRHPELYPLSLDLDELRLQVTALPEFKDSAACDNDQLETIRAAWNEEFLDRTQ